MTLKDLLTLYCEQQEATGYSVHKDHKRTNDGIYPLNEITIFIFFTGNFEQKRETESITFGSEAEAIVRYQILTQSNKAIA
jgi:hypothetical protein